MKRSTLRGSIFVSLVGIMLCSLSAYAAEANPAVLGMFTKILKAIETNDRASFIADGTTEFQNGLSVEKVKAVSDQLAPRLKHGYEATYLCELNQAGTKVHLWKLSFKDGGDDILAKLVLKESKVAGFWLQ